MAEAVAQAHANVVTQIPGGQMIIAGKWLKATQGSVDIGFGTTFSAPPYVVVSPNWVAEVGGIETITRVDTDRFQVTSKNAANNYYVSWIAVGPV